MHARLAAAEAADHHELFNPGSDLAPGVRQQSRGAASLPACTTLTIPAPQSVNKLFKNVPGRGRAKTRDYKNWLTECGWLVKEQLVSEGCDPVPGRVNVLIAVERDSLLADIDNRVKAILDLLVAQKVIEDDRYVVGVAASWSPIGNRQRPKARIAIMPAADHTLDFHLSPDGATGWWFINAPENDGDI